RIESGEAANAQGKFTPRVVFSSPMRVTQKTTPAKVAITTSKRGLKVIAAIGIRTGGRPGTGGVNQGWVVTRLRLRRGKQFVESIRVLRSYTSPRTKLSSNQTLFGFSL